MTVLTQRHGVPRPVRHAALATGVVLVACVVTGGWSLVSYVSAVDRLRASPGRVGGALLVDAERSWDGLLFAGLVVALVLLADGWLLVTRWFAARRPARQLSVRRISVRRGLLARTWLETGEGWIPVYFEPALLLLPAPAVRTVHGRRWVVVDVGRMVYPSGRVRRREPPGRRTDSPARPDAYAAGRAAAAGGLWRQVRVDAALAVPAPVVGVVWAYLDDGGVSGWLGASVLTAALALWWAAIRGSDPV